MTSLSNLPQYVSPKTRMPVPKTPMISWELFGSSEYDVSILFPVCNADYFKNGTTCLPCATLTSGVDGQKLLDDNTDTCVTSGGSRIFPRRGRQLRKIYYFPNYLLKTA